MHNAFSQLKLQDDASGTIAAIEQNLGLDKLGISLETVIDAMTDPNGDADKALDAALAKRTEPDAAAEPLAPKPLTVTRDDVGIYSRSVEAREHQPNKAPFASTRTGFTPG